MLLIPVAYYIFTLRGWKSVYYSGAIFVSSAPFILYNIHYFGSYFGGYIYILNGFDISSQMFTRLMGLLFSPSRGLFIYTPIILVSILGSFKIFQLPNYRVKNFLLVLGLSILAQIAVYSAFNVWWAGGSYGPRFFTGMLPTLSIFLGLFINEIHFRVKNNAKNLFLLFIVSLLLVWSVFVQFVGAFYYPSGDWNGDPNVDSHPERLWDWNDTQITRTFQAGMVSPYDGIKQILNAINMVRMSEHDIARDMTLKSGWLNVEIGGSTPIRWMHSDANLLVQSTDNRTATLILWAQSFHSSRTLEIYSGDDLAARVTVPNTSFINVTASVSLRKGENTIQLHVPEGCERPHDIEELNNFDNRCLSVAVQNITLGDRKSGQADHLSSFHDIEN
jgi:hypothetical protein